MHYQNENREVLFSKMSQNIKPLFICNLLHDGRWRQSWSWTHLPNPPLPPSTQPPSAVLSPDAWKIAANHSVNLIGHVCARADLSEASWASDPLPPRSPSLLLWSRRACHHRKSRLSSIQINELGVSAGIKKVLLPGRHNHQKDCKRTV